MYARRRGSSARRGSARAAPAGRRGRGRQRAPDRRRDRRRRRQRLLCPGTARDSRTTPAWPARCRPARSREPTGLTAAGLSSMHAAAGRGLRQLPRARRHRPSSTGTRSPSAAPAGWRTSGRSPSRSRWQTARWRAEAGRADSRVRRLGRRRPRRARRRRHGSSPPPRGDHPAARHWACARYCSPATTSALPVPSPTRFGINEVIAGVLPEGKATAVKELQAAGRGRGHGWGRGQRRRRARPGRPRPGHGHRH